METLETERLLFRQITENDLDDLAALYADPDVMRFYPRVRTKEETREAIKVYQQRYAEDGLTLMATILKKENKFIGRCGIVMQDIEGKQLPEVGYMLDKWYWNGGFGTEAAIAFRDYGFRELKFKKIVSIIRPDNLPSQGVAKNNGMEHEKDIIFDAVECRLYSITKTKWKTLTKKAEAIKTV